MEELPAAMNMMGPCPMQGIPASHRAGPMYDGRFRMECLRLMPGCPLLKKSMSALHCKHALNKRKDFAELAVQNNTIRFSYTMSMSYCTVFLLS
jgi:hypothetical protein